MPESVSRTLTQCIQICLQYLGFGPPRPKRVVNDVVVNVTDLGDLGFEDGAFLRTSGDVSGVELGQVAPVLWSRANSAPGRRGVKPTIVLAHQAKKAQPPSHVRVTKTGVVEELFIGPVLGTTGSFDVWYRTLTECRALDLRKDLPVEPDWVAWSEEGDGILVGTAGANYHIFEVPGDPDVVSARRNLTARFVRSEALADNQLIVTSPGTFPTPLRLGDIIKQTVQWAAAGSPSLARGHLMVVAVFLGRTYSLSPTADHRDDVYVIDATAGTILWSSETGAASLRTAGVGVSPTVYAFNARVLRYGRDASQMRVWVAGNAIVNFLTGPCGAYTYPPQPPGSELPGQQPGEPLTVYTTPLWDPPDDPSGTLVACTWGYWGGPPYNIFHNVNITPVFYNAPAGTAYGMGTVIDGAGAIVMVAVPWGVSDDPNLGQFREVLRMPFDVIGDRYLLFVRDNVPGSDPDRGQLYLVSLEDWLAKRMLVERHSIYGSERVTYLEYALAPIAPNLLYAPVDAATYATPEGALGHHALPGGDGVNPPLPNDPVRPSSTTPAFLKIADAQGMPTLALGELADALPVESGLNDVAGLAPLDPALSPVAFAPPVVTLSLVPSPAGPGFGVGPLGQVYAAAAYVTPSGESPIGPTQSIVVTGFDNDLVFEAALIPNAATINIYVRMPDVFSPEWVLFLRLAPGTRHYEFRGNNVGYIPSVAGPLFSLRVINDPTLLGNLHQER